MKLKIMQSNLSKALNTVSKAVSNKPTIPILSNVLIEAKDSTMRLTATDLEIGVNVILNVEVETEGKVTINARLVNEFVNALPSSKVELELVNNVLKVKNDSSKAEFATISYEEFPEIASANGEPTISVDSALLSRALAQTVFATALDDSRPILTGVLFDLSGGNLTLVGIDGFRLSKKVIKVDSSASFKFVIPAKAINEVIRTFNNTENKINLFYLEQKNQVIFKQDDIEVITRILEGEFPDYQSIIPTSASTKFEVPKEIFASSVKLVSVFAKNVIGNKTLFEIDSKTSKLKLSAEANELGENDTTLDIHSLEGSDLRTAYNARFLQDIINNLQSDDLLYETNGVSLPGVFKDKSDDGFLHIIMPMKVE